MAPESISDPFISNDRTDVSEHTFAEVCQLFLDKIIPLLRPLFASAALNKWLKSKIGRGYTIHSFRHSMRDRLRAVECPSEIIDQIGGWLTQGVGNSYGSGFPVAVIQKWIERLE